jgi:hypothetical protein
LNELPNLPLNLLTLNCSSNKLTLCPNINYLEKLYKINCSNNQIRDIPQIPDVIIVCSLMYSNLEKVVCKCEKLDGSECCKEEKYINYDNNQFIDIYKNHPNVKGHYFNHNVKKNKFIQFITSIFK